MEDDNLDIFNFGNSSRLKPGLLRPRGPPALSGRATDTTPSSRGGRPLASHETGESSSYSEDCSTNSDEIGGSSSDDDSDSEGKPRRRRRRRFGRQRPRKSSLAASRLLKKSVKSSDDEEAIASSPKRLKPDNNDDEDDSRSPTPSPSPPQNVPSPPPPGHYMEPNPPDQKSRRILNKANDVLNRLRYTTPSLHSSFSDFQSDLNDSVTYIPPDVVETMNVRVRWKGKIKKYAVNKMDPFSRVISLLSQEQNVSGDNYVLLSHKTTTISPNDSPASLGLTTADILDAVVMSGSADALPSLNDSQSSSSGDHITIKVQTSDRSMVYSLAKTDPLQKAMTAFASELKTDITKLKFSFDGDTITPSQTAADLDMENDDCIDVTVLS